MGLDFGFISGGFIIVSCLLLILYLLYKAHLYYMANKREADLAVVNARPIVHGVIQRYFRPTHPEPNVQFVPIQQDSPARRPQYREGTPHPNSTLRARPQPNSLAMPIHIRGTPSRSRENTPLSLRSPTSTLVSSDEDDNESEYAPSNHSSQSSAAASSINSPVSNRLRQRNQILFEED